MEIIDGRINAFITNPVTNLVKGLALFMIGVSNSSHTFRDDITQRQVCLDYGLIIIGLLSMLDALPHFIESLATELSRLFLRGRRLLAFNRFCTNDDDLSRFRRIGKRGKRAKRIRVLEAR